jgi:hypothetical protein
MQTSSFSGNLKKKALLSILISLALAGCGGGGGNDAPTTDPSVPTTPTNPTPDDTSPVVTPPVVTPTTPVTSDMSPSCSDCGVTGPTAYAGSGVGVWHKKNTGTAAEDVKVAVSGLVNKDVTLIFTNETNTAVAMPSIALRSALVPPAPLSSLSSKAADTPKTNAGVAEFNRSGWTKLVSAPKAKANASLSRMSTSAPQLAAVGATRSFRHHDGTTRATTLRKQVTLSDGVVANFWVQTTESTAARVSATVLDEMATAFSKSGGIYEKLVDTGGALWGPHGYSELISGTGQPIDIVFMNLTPDGEPYGELGYFYAINSFTQDAVPESNQAVSLYLDTETLYLDGAEGRKTIKMTMAHEGMHMSNFYRRGVSMSPAHQYDTWLEEMTAMMMEDAASEAIDPTYNPTRDMRFPTYLNYASYNCPLLDFTGYGAVCESYSVSGSFGGFLLRQMGMPFFKNLLTGTNVDSEASLNSAITAYRPQSGLGQELRKFAVAAIPAPSAATAPAGFNFPARVDGTYSIPAIDAQAFKLYRTLPSAVPSQLKAYASFPVVRKGITGTFQETVRVPAGTTLSVVVN